MEDFLIRKPEQVKLDVLAHYVFDEYSATEDEYEESLEHVNEETEDPSSSSFSNKLALFEPSPRSRSTSTGSKRSASSPSKKEGVKKPKKK